MQHAIDVACHDRWLVIVCEADFFCSACEEALCNRRFYMWQLIKMQISHCTLVKGNERQLANLHGSGKNMKITKRMRFKDVHMYG